MLYAAALPTQLPCMATLHAHPLLHCTPLRPARHTQLPSPASPSPADIVPEAQVEALVEMYTPEAEERLLGGSPDFVLDAIDNIDTKVRLCWSACGGLAGCRAAARLLPCHTM